MNIRIEQFNIFPIKNGSEGQAQQTNNTSSDSVFADYNTDTHSDSIFDLVNTYENNAFLQDESSQYSDICNDSLNSYSGEDIQTLETALNEYSIEQIKTISAKYTKRDDLTSEEYGQIIALDQIYNNFNNLYSQYETQVDSEGFVDDVYNKLKDITNLGITREMVQEDFDNYSSAMASLQAVINGDIQSAKTAANNEFSRRINEADNFEDTLNIFISYFNDENTALEAFNKFLSDNKHLTEPMASYEDIKISKQDNNFVLSVKFKDTDTSFIDEDKIKDGYVTYNISNDNLEVPIPIQNIILNADFDTEKYSSILSDGISDFESLYKFYIGKDYSAENIESYIKESYNYTQVNSGLVTAYDTEQKLKGACFETAFEVFTQIYKNDEDKAIEAFNNYYETLFEKNSNDISKKILDNNLTSVSVQKNNSGQIEFVMKLEPSDESDKSSLHNLASYDGKSDYAEIIYNPSDNKTQNNDIYNLNLCFSQINTDVAKNELLQKRFETAYKDSTGKTTEDTINSYFESYENVFGKNSIQNTLHEYINDMDTYAQKLSTAIQIGSIGASFVCPAFGLAAVGGGFVDNAIDGINMATNETENEDWQGLIKDTFKEASYIAIGMGIGKTASSLNSALTTKLLDNTQLSHKTITALATSAEAGADGALSIGFDYLTTGNLNLEGNGFGTMLDIVSGIRGYKALSDLDTTYTKTKDGILTTYSKDGYTKYTPNGDGTYKAVTYDINDRGKIISEGKTVKMLDGQMISYDSIKTAELYLSNVEPTYIKDILKLDDSEYEKCLSLIKNQGYDAYFSGQIAKLNEKDYTRALELIENGIPVSKAADTAVLKGEEAKRVDDLLENDKISPYYIDKLASLDKNSYERAIKLIEEENFTATSAISVADKKGDKFIQAVEEIKSGKKTMKKELTPEIEAILEAQTINLYNQSNPNISYAKIDILQLANDSTAKITARTKGIQSTLNKLITKFENDKLEINDIKIDITKASTQEIEQACKNAIGDSFGTRIQLESIKENEAQEIITNCLKNTKLTYEEFIAYMQGKGAPEGVDNIDAIAKYTIDTLKEKQTQKTVERLISAIEHNDIHITELNNYGSDLSSYFTASQLHEIAQAYNKQTGEKLTIVTKLDIYDGKGAIITKDGFEDDFAIYKTEEAQKDSGYTSTQMNVTHKFNDGQEGNGELQIRGTFVNEFGDIEHIPYDIRKGKITAKDTEYSEIYNTIKNMSDESYKLYNQYLSKTYDYLRLQELGIKTEKPKLEGIFKTKSGQIISDSDIQALSMEGLSKLSKKIHG